MSSEYRENILFVDDEHNVLDGIKRSLHSINHKWSLHFCSNGNDALALCDELSIDLIVTDGKMPAMSGNEFVRLLKNQERTKNIPIIMLTGDSSLKMKALQYGVVEFLNKPLIPDEFILRIDNILKINRLSRELAEKNKELTVLNSSLEALNAKILAEQQKVIELEQKNSVMAMVVTANHEINQPLTVVFGSLDLFKHFSKNNQLDANQNKFLNKIEENLLKIDTILKKYKYNDEFKFVNYGSSSKMVVFEEDEEQKKSETPE